MVPQVALILLVAGCCARAAVEPRTLELKDVLGFTATEARAGDLLVVRLGGTCGHSALVVTRVEEAREGDTVNVRVRLSLATAGRSGTFEHRVEVPAGVRTVTFGEARAAVWTAAAAKPATACDEAKRGGPGDVVRALYAAFPWDGQAALMAAPREVLARFFDDRLTRLLLNDLECRRRTGEYCWLTVDPIYAAQDAQVTEMRFCGSSRGPEWIEVRFTNFGRGTVVAYRVGKPSPLGWRIVDVDDGHGPTLVEFLSTPLPR